MAVNQVPILLTIAGSDSGGGAGIQADLKTFAAHGVYGACVITAVTAQNTVGVTRVQEVDLDVIEAQIDAVAEDLNPKAVKTGMLSSPAIVSLVAEKIRQYGWDLTVVDPVMIASTGARLIQDEAIETYRNELLPLAAVTTPNLPEAAELAGVEINSIDGASDAAKAIHALGPVNVIVKGGHMERAGESADFLYDGSEITEFRLPWIDSNSNHGTGCTFASSLASHLALGDDILDAFKGAKQFVWEAMNRAYVVGQGHGPLNHMWRFTAKD